MTEHGQAYADALADAQQRGYAEADPTLDVNGTDAAHKLAILAQLAFAATVPVSTIDRRGIAGVHQMDIQFARELGYAIKLLGEAWLDAKTNQLALHVSPVLLRHQTLLAQVRGADNAIRILGDAVGETLLYGRGAGQMPTASAVVADIIDLAVGRAQKTFQVMRLWSSGKTNIILRPSATVRSRFYLRLLVADKLGVMADVTRVLAENKISIASVVQHEGQEDHEGDTVPLVIMTHTALTEQFRAAVAALDSLGNVRPPSMYYPVGE
jgi:homoserine dehydrogenase